MKNSKITISLFRVSNDGQYLDMMFECPQGYYLNSLMIEVRSFDSQVKKFMSQFFDLSNALFIDSEHNPITSLNKWVVRIPLTKLGINYPAIYKGTFKILKISIPDPYAEFTCDSELHVYINQYGYKELSDESKSGHLRSDLHFDPNGNVIINFSDELIDPKPNYYVCNNSEGIPCVYDVDFPTFIPCEQQINTQEEVECDCQNGECLEDHAICSDVSQAYKCMLDDLMKLEDPCFEISDELIRKYLLLYGHQSALSIGDYETAERYFKLITSCFDICRDLPKCVCCNSPVNFSRTDSRKSCNCHNS